MSYASDTDSGETANLRGLISAFIVLHSHIIISLGSTPEGIRV